MRMSRFSEEQIIGFLKQAEAGRPVAELSRQIGITDATFYKWRSKFAGLEVSEALLRSIARELMDAVRRNVTIDWTLRENVQAQLRVLVKRILRKYGYPPDKQEKATKTVLDQAALLSGEWAMST